MGNVKKSAVVEVDRFTVSCPHCDQSQTGPVSGDVFWYDEDAYQAAHFYGEGGRWGEWVCDGCESEIAIDADVVSALEAKFHRENVAEAGQ